MQTGFYANTGAMVTQFNRLDLIANNLANANTTAYKKSNVVIGDFMRLYQEQRDELPLYDNTKQGSQFLNRSMVRVPHIVEKYISFKSGGFESTDNPLDLSLKSPEFFFKVRTPGGDRYTQNGAFLINKQGQLVTQEGYLVLSKTNEAIDIVPDAQVQISKNGRLEFIDDKIPSENELGQQLMIVKFTNPKYLEKEGDSLYKNDKEQPLVSDLEDLVMSGFLERSNINAVTEMTGLIEANRLVGMYQKAMDAHNNDMNRDAIEKLGSTRG